MKQQGLTVGQAADRLGVTVDTIKRRLKRGEYPDAYREPTPQGFRWKIPTSNLDDDTGTAPGSPPDPPGASQRDDRGQEVLQPAHQLIETLQRELDIRNREIERLHIVVAQQSAAIERQATTIAALPDKVPDRSDDDIRPRQDRSVDADQGHAHEQNDSVNVWKRLWRSITGRS
jgi:uncharacterized coiled-coil protein SlyX